jgi:group II intron reverse transcriptase/maturase
MNDAAEEMKHLHQLAKQDPGKRFTRLWRTLTDPYWLAQAWEQIRRNHGSWTAGVDRMTARDVDMPMIIQWAAELRRKAYRPTPVRRCYIEKGNGRLRPLGIPTIKDRVIQQGLKMLLEPIFEADFKTCSHGFRQGRSTHTALRDVARGYVSASWIIEGDIKGCFDNIPHAGLMTLIARRIADEKVLHLVKQFLQAGYLEDRQLHRTYSGTPQGGILSPLLANIFLQQLDEFVETELAGNRSQTIKERNARLNPEYQQLSRRLQKLRKQLSDAAPKARKILLAQIIQLERQRKNTPLYDKEKRHPCKVKYVRYADDFVALVAGRKADAVAIKDKMRQRLAELGLVLSEEKTKLTHWSRRVQFLGYQIQGKRRTKGVGIYAVLMIPAEKIRQVSEAIERACGHCQTPTAKVLTEVGALFRGWCYYYRYANSPQAGFSQVAHKTWWTFAHYLARKTKTRSIKRLARRERKAGRLVTLEKNGRKRLTFQMTVKKRPLYLDIFPPKTGQIITAPTKQDWQIDLKPLKPLGWPSAKALRDSM